MNTTEVWKDRQPKLDLQIITEEFLDELENPDDSDDTPHWYACNLEK